MSSQERGTKDRARDVMSKAVQGRQGRDPELRNAGGL